MIKIDVRMDIDRALQKLRDVTERQVPYATALALNKTADAVKDAEIKEMKDVFDRPTPITLDSLFVKRATKYQLTATVGIKDFMGKGTPASKWLAAQIKGGSRHLKKFEKALQSVGALPPGYFVVPGSACKLDQYGNIPGSLITQLLSYFNAFPEMGYRANMTAKRRALLAKGSAKKGTQGVVYFVGQPAGGKLPLGIWARYTFHAGSAIKPVLIFVRHAQFQKLFDFEYVARKTVEKEFPAQFRAAIAEAMRTAR